MYSNKYKILIIEDEGNIRHFVKTIFKSDVYQIIEARNLAEAKVTYMSHSPNLVLLDLGLPDGDGMDFISYVRKEYSTPIIVLSARTTDKDKVLALDAGANDYITKPFSIAELQARVRCSLRIHQQTMNRSLCNDSNLKIGDLTIDYDKRQVLMKGVNIKLTQTEFNIVALLASYSGKVLMYSDIIKEIWKYSDSGSVKKLQVNMVNIRKKMGVKVGEPQYIINELGLGYRFNMDIEESLDF